MSKLNFVDPSRVDAWLLQVAQATCTGRDDAARAARVMASLFRPELMSDRAAAEPVRQAATELKNNAVDITGPRYAFVPEQKPGLRFKMERIARWLVSSGLHNTGFDDTRHGEEYPRVRPLVRSIEQASFLATDFFSILPTTSYGAFDAGKNLRPVMVFDDKWRIVELVHRDAWQEEDRLMGAPAPNGGGSTATGFMAARQGRVQARIFSLRDDKNVPQATIKLECKTGNLLAECTAKHGARPGVTLTPKIAAFLDRTHTRVPDDLALKTGLVVATDQTGKRRVRSRMPSMF